MLCRVFVHFSLDSMFNKVTNKAWAATIDTAFRRLLRIAPHRPGRKLLINLFCLRRVTSIAVAYEMQYFLGKALCDAFPDT